MKFSKLVGIAELPLHYGSCPRWLFPRMSKLSGIIAEMIVSEYNTETFLKKISDPFFFQAFGCAVGFDWHSSGLTTTLTAAIKEALQKRDIGLYVAGGKGKTSRKTPDEINKITENFSDAKAEKLIKASRLSAKIDNAALQDFFNLYHHAFLFDEKSKWTVVQQGMNPETGYARRYHWFSEDVESENRSFVNEPHSAICCDKKVKPLNLVARESAETRKCSLEILQDKNTKKLFMEKEHFPKIKQEVLLKIEKFQPQTYEELLLVKGVGAKTLRALALISQLIYGAEPSFKDPCKFAFAVGGKDGYPYSIQQEHYDKTIQLLQDAVKQAKLNSREKILAIKRLQDFV